ncbi:MAG: hypothetical protein ACC669_05780 [bacterium]
MYRLLHLVILIFIVLFSVPSTAIAEEERFAKLDYNIVDFEPIKLLSPAPEDDDSWDITDRALLISTAALWYIDYQQTMQIVEDENRYELNPFLGENPSKDRVNLHFAGSFALNYYIADKLSSKNRKTYLTLMIMLESAVINHNVEVGIKF